MEWRALSLAIAIPLLAAILGNAFISENALIWYERLNRPWFQLPLWGAAIVALLVYIGYGIIIFRAFVKHLWAAVALSAAVVMGNEVWNAFFFGTRNLMLTFWITVGFAGLVLVQAFSIRRGDRLSFGISLIYLAWVVLYDLTWLYQLATQNT
ncbi:MAG: TspO/MBR family protein [Elainellaceae cyanobacterium]